MKKILISIMSLAFLINNNAQETKITFQAADNNNSISEITLANLRTGEEKVINEGDELIFRSISTLVSDYNNHNEIKVYLNNNDNYTYIALPVTTSGKYRIQICALSGQTIKSKQIYLSQGLNQLKVCSKDLGPYIINIIYNGRIHQSIKSTQNIKATADICHMKNQHLKGANEDYTMEYLPGDVISCKFTDDDGDVTIQNLYPESIGASKIYWINFGKCIDGDGNRYPAVSIEGKLWMAINLRTSKYSDGTEIPLIRNDSDWAELNDNNTSKAYCYYNNNMNTNTEKYGYLYTYAAAVNGQVYDGSSNIQGACPDGWHIPTNEEWEQLIENVIEFENAYRYLSRDRIAKSISSRENWESSYSPWAVGNDISLNNASGFNAQPSGLRGNNTGAYQGLSYSGLWWCCEEADSESAWARYIGYQFSEIMNPESKKSSGLSIRCIIHYHY